MGPINLNPRWQISEITAIGPSLVQLVLFGECPSTISIGCKRRLMGETHWDGLNRKEINWTDHPFTSGLPANPMRTTRTHVTWSTQSIRLSQHGNLQDVRIKDWHQKQACRGWKILLNDPQWSMGYKHTYRMNIVAIRWGPLKNNEQLINRDPILRTAAQDSSAVDPPFFPHSPVTNDISASQSGHMHIRTGNMY